MDTNGAIRYTHKDHDRIGIKCYHFEDYLMGDNRSNILAGPQ